MAPVRKVAPRPAPGNVAVASRIGEGNGYRFPPTPTRIYLQGTSSGIVQLPSSALERLSSSTRLSAAPLSTISAATWIRDRPQ